jgi:hypothetical protein
MTFHEVGFVIGQYGQKSYTDLFNIRFHQNLIGGLHLHKKVHL